MIQIIVQAQKASCRKSSGEKITTGMVGKKVSFDFSAEWDGLVKTAVFEGSGVTKDVTLSGDTAVIPHECLTANPPISTHKMAVTPAPRRSLPRNWRRKSLQTQTP